MADWRFAPGGAPALRIVAQFLRQLADQFGGHRAAARESALVVLEPEPASLLSRSVRHD